MLSVVDKLPEHVSMSVHLMGKASRRREGKRKFKYLCVQSLGVSYYVPITKAVWEAFRLGEVLRNQDGEHTWMTGGLDDALRDVVSALYAQVRDQVVAEAAQQVAQEVHHRIDEVMWKPLVGRLNELADQKVKLLGDGGKP